MNWFGFETSATMVAGLWAGSSSLTQDFKTVVWRFKLLGFNAVRLPFSFKASLAFSMCRARASMCQGSQGCKPVIWHMKLLCFDAVRLPFSFKASSASYRAVGHLNCPSMSRCQAHTGLHARFLMHVPP